MAKAGKKTTEKSVHTYTHEGKKRRNNPPVGLVSAATDKLNGKTKYQHDPHIDPALSWAGKAEGISFDVQNVSLHIHERIDPSRIVQSFLTPKQEPQQLSLFLEPENEPPLPQAIDFYRHDQDWTNRLIAGDSLLVMNSLLVKEGMAGKVQMVYIDPPYGIKYNSNFQPFTNKKNVRDGNDDDLPAEPEMIQAFRDTWELGIHSYLSYLRDRLLLAYELLSENGSIFVQINDQNIHSVHHVLDEIFGSQNCLNCIPFVKTTGITTQFLASNVDFLLWYGKDRQKSKYHRLFTEKNFDAGNADAYNWVELPDGTRRGMTREEKADPRRIPAGSQIYMAGEITTQGNPVFPFEFEGKVYRQAWKTNPAGMMNLAAARRLHVAKNSLRYVRCLTDFPFVPVTQLWKDTGTGSFTSEKIYVVQTGLKAVERCLLLASDPGDLVLDPTCGSGTTAYAAEKLGRRWITCDTSRVAIALAKQRLLTAKFDYFTLSHPDEGIRSGFNYQRVPHLMLETIATGEPAREETIYDKPEVDSRRVRVTGPFTVEAVPSLRVKPFDGAVPETQTAGSAFSRTGDTNRLAEWIDELRETGIRAVGSKIIHFSLVEPSVAFRFIHAVADISEKSGGAKKALLSFGPDYGALDRRQVQLAMEEARGLKDKPDFVIFAAFQFDPEAAKDIDLMEWKGVTILKAQMSVDLFTADLRKKRSSNQSYWLIGQPEVKPEKTKDGKWIVRLLGFDYYDPIKGEIISKGTKQIAMWFLDMDYDDRSIIPSQVFFPESDEKRDWTKLAKALKAEVNEEALKAFSGVVSLPFSPGKNARIGVKIIDNRGIESFVIKDLE